METLSPQLAQLLNDTIKPQNDVVSSATEALHRLSLIPDFPFSLISVAAGGENQGQRLAAATYLKNFAQRHIVANPPSLKVSNEFRDCLMRALVQVELPVLKVLVETFRITVVSEFVEGNSWPELVLQLRSVIHCSSLIGQGESTQCNTVNSLTVLLTIIKPFQYFLNPKVAKEPVPPQLELIAKEILVPLLSVFHQLVQKALCYKDRTEVETERILLIICKCMYFAVRSHMPSSLTPLLPSFCCDIFEILGSLNFDGMTTLEDGLLLRLKTGKRGLLFFCSLVTRHRKHSDKLMSGIFNSVSNIVNHSSNVGKLDFLSDRIVSLAFDVISHILETGPGWRLVSPHFQSLLRSAIFPALVMNEKDILEWKEDPDEFIRKNLPSDLEAISGWKEDLFTARKSAVNLLGVISRLKGPPMVISNNSSAISSKRKKGEKNKRKYKHSFVGELLVLPFLSKFPIPSDTTPAWDKLLNNYYGVLMAYGSLQDFMKEQNHGYTEILVRTRVLPLYSLTPGLPYLIAAANWVLGELASCLPHEMSADVFSSLLKALVLPDADLFSCYPVRASAAGAIHALLENDYLPPQWLPLLQVVVSRIDNEEDDEASILFQLLSIMMEADSKNIAHYIPFIVSSLVGAVLRRIPPSLEPWPQVVERGFMALAAMAQVWEDSLPEEIEQNELRKKWRSDQINIARIFSSLLQQAWLIPIQEMERELPHPLPPSSCINDASILLRSIMESVTETNEIIELKISELLVVWADLIADWHAWEELEDLSIFDTIKEAVNLDRTYGLMNFIIGRMHSPPAPPVPQCSIIEGLGAFVSEAILQYPSATWRACSCVHLLLHVPSFSFEAEGVRQSLTISFSRAAFSRFKEIRSNPGALWKPLLLAISSCYLCYPDVVKSILEKNEDKGFTIWASALGYISTSTFEYVLSDESEIKLIVMALAKVVEYLLGSPGNQGNGLSRDCFISLMEVAIRLKDVQEEEEKDEDQDENDADEETDDYDDDEDSEDDECEETEEEFLDRYAREACALESEMDVEEGDLEVQVQKIELGRLGEVDPQNVILSLIQRYNHFLIQGQALPPQLVNDFLNAFPEHSSLFQHCH